MTMYDRYAAGDWDAGKRRSDAVAAFLKAQLGPRLLSLTSLGKGNDTTRMLTPDERAASPKSEADWRVEYLNPRGEKVVQFLEVSGSDRLQGSPLDIWIAAHKVKHAQRVYGATGVMTVFALVYPGKMLFISSANRNLAGAKATTKFIKGGRETYAVLPATVFKTVTIH